MSEFDFDVISTASAPPRRRPPQPVPAAKEAPSAQTKEPSAAK